MNMQEACLGMAHREPDIPQHHQLYFHRICAYTINTLGKGVHMSTIYNTSASKKPTNLTVNKDLLDQAKKLNINISSVLEKALEYKVKELLQAGWSDQNADAITAYNNHIEENGSYGDTERTF
jgi:antitoxin CcdA